jgi:hypothetical protein
MCFSDFSEIIGVEEEGDDFILSLRNAPVIRITKLSVQFVIDNELRSDGVILYANKKDISATHTQALLDMFCNVTIPTEIHPCTNCAHTKCSVVCRFDAEDERRPQEEATQIAA